MSGPIVQGEAIAARTFGPFGTEAVAAYATASGDDNPLHVDPAIAAKAGLARPPIHGMLIVGCFQSFLEGWRPDVRVRKLTAKFVRPVLVGDSISVSGKVVQATAGEPAIIRIVVKDGAGTPVCLGEAFVES